MTYTGPINGLFKFLERRYLDDFLRGSLYMNTLQYFATREASDTAAAVRRDQWEGSAHVSKIESVDVRINGAYQPIKGIDHQLPWFPANGIAANVFCMYAVAKNWAPPVHEEVFMFGDTFACITDISEFFRRLKAAEDTCDYRMSCDLVEYFSSNYEGETGIFKKRSQFRHQSELRIAIQPGPGKPYKLEVGDLSDIVVSGASSEMNNCLYYQPSA